jgi:soluble epoxide hydrolase / lipid-phosphate phosphatase
MIFIHGWPAIALCWRPQLLHFGALGYHCVAMDLLGYGKSPAPDDVSAYSCENLVADQLALLSHLKGTSAIWVGHDWGCGPLWTLASHHPEKCRAIISICIPYRVLELGLEELKKWGINREMYPEDQFPHGQWDYQIHYEQNGKAAAEDFQKQTPLAVRLFFGKARPASFKKPSPTASVTKFGSWFATRGSLEVPLSNTVLDEEMYEALVESLERNGWWAPTAYYLNHARNREYNRDDNVHNGGILEMPVLYIDAKYDSVCSVAQTPTLAEPMKRLCKDLEWASVDTAHWANLEQPDECNGFMTGMLRRKGLLPELEKARL